VSEEANKKLPGKNRLAQLLSLYTYAERHDIQGYRRTDWRTVSWCR